MKNLLLKSYFLLWIIFAVFSFVVADPNFILLKYDWFVKAQNFLWQNILPLRNFRTAFFLVLVVLLFSNYLLILKNWDQLALKTRKSFWLFLLLISLPLLLSYNALSHDVFNYIFNAKMVLIYHVNPHVHTALEFSGDPLLRFMNNTHTAAPYGYLWTALSLLPYLLGLNKFLLTFFAFKFFALLALLLALLISEKFFKKVNYRQLAIFFLNPLVLIEVISSAHNDLWMLVPALLAVYLANNLGQQKWLKVLSIIALMTFSILIKYSTLALVPLILYSLLKDKLGRLGKLALWQYQYELMSLALFVPLLTERSRQFLPWYLLWPLIFVPLVKNKWWRNLLIVFSLSSLLRYLPWFYLIPWMSFGMDTSAQIIWEKAITWLIPAFYLLLSGVVFLFNKKREE